MEVLGSQSGNNTQREDVLTSAEAAAYLRVPEAALLQLMNEEAIPARKIGGEWRFLKKALDDWLRFPARPRRDYWMVNPDWFLESPFANELLHLLEERLLRKLGEEFSSKRGSKRSVLKHFGIFRDDD